MDENQPCREMPKYKCHKVVHALKIGAMEIHEDKSATIVPKDDRYAKFTTVAGFAARFPEDWDDAGYYVVYEDGYAAWSPTKAFEEGYTLIE